MDQNQRNFRAGARGLVLAVILGLFAAGPAAAERELVPLGQLIQRADVVVAGEVKSVAAAGTLDERAVIEVSRSLLGTPRVFMTVAGTPTDAEGHAFHVGDRVLAFLSPSSTSSHYDIVDGGTGIFALDEWTTSGALDLVAAWQAKKGPAQRLSSLLGHVTTEDPPVPAALLAAAGEDFAEGALPQVEGAKLLALSCGQAEPVNRSVHQWALRSTGRLGIEEARPCLESRIRLDSASEEAFDLSMAQSAVDAIVELGGSSSVSVLQDALSSIPQQVNSTCDPSFASTVLQGVGVLGDRGFHVNGTLVAQTAFRVPFRSAASTAVHALGLIRDREARIALDRIARMHPDSLIRNQASITLARIGD